MAVEVSRKADDPAATDQALLELLAALRDRGYRFVAPTPATQARALKHPGKRRAHGLRGVFGWSLWFEPATAPGDLIALMDEAGVLERRGGRLRSRIRVSSLGDLLFLHSAYPTKAEGAVFFGPDSYRFAAFVRRELAGLAGPVRRLVDIGAGSGVGAICAAPYVAGADLVLTDINPAALRMARINAATAGLQVRTVEAPGLSGVDDPIDLAIANPPYIIDSEERDYRDGGDMHGARVSLDMAEEAMRRLAPDGRLLLYTGSAIIEGEDPLRAAMAALASAAGCSLRYEEIDPDVFGEELDHPAYRDVDRIAVIGAVMIKA